MPPSFPCFCFCLQVYLHHLSNPPLTSIIPEPVALSHLIHPALFHFVIFFFPLSCSKTCRSAPSRNAQPPYSITTYSNTPSFIYSTTNSVMCAPIHLHQVAFIIFFIQWTTCLPIYFLISAPLHPFDKNCAVFTFCFHLPCLVVLLLQSGDLLVLTFFSLSSGHPNHSPFQWQGGHQFRFPSEERSPERLSRSKCFGRSFSQFSVFQLTFS